MRQSWGILFVVISFVILCSQLPITSALKFGDDEGIELMKGFLCSKGYTLYTQIWNDQPPVLTMLLDGAFRLFGATLPVGRLLAAAFGLLLFCSLFLIVRQRGNLWMAFLAVFFLVCSPGVLMLSLSVMLEVPTFAIALLSVYCLFRWSGRKRPVWLWISGLVMGVALGTKLTAILTLPAILLEIVLATRNHKPGWQKIAMIAAAQWMGATVLVVILITVLWGKESLQTSFLSHFSERPVPGMPRPEDFPFPLTMVVGHFECVAAALAGILLSMKRRTLRQMAFPITLLVTGLVIHLIHRPCWQYYYLHLAIPLSWLAAYAIYEAIIWSFAVLAKARSWFASAAGWKGVVICAVAALVILRSERRLEGGIIDIRRRPPAESDAIVIKMKQNAMHTHWVYCEEPIYAFASCSLTPPELAVVVIKRFWSHQLTASTTVEICRQRQVDELVLSPQSGPEWQAWLQADFVNIYRDASHAMFISRTIHP